MVRCPACGGPLVQQCHRMTYDCEGCGFSVSQLDAVRLSARSPQEAADLKAAMLPTGLLDGQ